MQQILRPVHRRTKACWILKIHEIAPTWAAIPARRSLFTPFRMLLPHQRRDLGKHEPRVYGNSLPVTGANQCGVVERVAIIELPGRDVHRANAGLFPEISQVVRVYASAITRVEICLDS